jgi:hypothetical protein
MVRVVAVQVDTALAPEHLVAGRALNLPLVL